MASGSVRRLRMYIQGLGMTVPKLCTAIPYLRMPPGTAGGRDGGRYIYLTIILAHMSRV